MVEVLGPVPPEILQEAKDIIIWLRYAGIAPAGAAVGMIAGLRYAIESALTGKKPVEIIQKDIEAIRQAFKRK